MFESRKRAADFHTLHADIERKLYSEAATPRRHDTHVLRPLPVVGPVRSGTTGDVFLCGRTLLQMSALSWALDVAAL